MHRLPRSSASDPMRRADDRQRHRIRVGCRNLHPVAGLRHRLSLPRRDRLRDGQPGDGRNRLPRSVWRPEELQFGRSRTRKVGGRVLYTGEDRLCLRRITEGRPWMTSRSETGRSSTACNTPTGRKRPSDRGATAAFTRFTRQSPITRIFVKWCSTSKPGTGGSNATPT